MTMIHVCIQQDLRSYGWRLPFLLALPMGVLGVYLFSKLEDGEEFKDAKAQGTLADNPIKVRHCVCVCVCVCVIFICLFFVNLIFAPLVRFYSYSLRQHESLSTHSLSCTLSAHCVMPTFLTHRLFCFLLRFLHCMHMLSTSLRLSSGESKR